MFDAIYIFVPSCKQIIKISEGSGDNLSDDDISNGYIDYIYYEQYELDSFIREIGGGIVLLDTPFRKLFSCTEDCISNVLDMAYSDESVPYIVLK